MEMVNGKKTGHRSSNAVVMVAVGLCAVAAVWAQAFAFDIGGAVATQDFRVKSAAFAFRTTGCPEPAKVQVSATAEGVVDGARKSRVLTIHAASNRPGVWAIQPEWDRGQWVVVLKGTCNDTVAGAIVPVRASAFVREAVRLYPHAPMPAEVEAAIKANQ